jgi:putative ABC transport system ATP-binding protein
MNLTRAVIETIELTKCYRQGASVVRALDGVSLRVEPGELLAIMGRSGSGKTTLLDVLGLLQRPTSGRVLLDGADVAELSDRRWTELRRRRIGFVFQEYNLLASLTALENVLLPVRYERTAGLGEGLRRARYLLDLVGLASRAAHRPRELSGGERQRVAIARALVMSPGLVLADEPTAAVDSETSTVLLDLVRHLNAVEGITFVLVTHDADVAAAARRVVRLHDGQVVADYPLTARAARPRLPLPRNGQGLSIHPRWTSRRSSSTWTAS